jgi:hypothetical protein
MEASVIITYILTAYIVLMVVAVAGFFIGKTFWDQRRYKKNKEEVIGKVLCEFAPTSGGQVSRELLEEYQGIIKRPESTSKASFFMPIKKTEKTEFTEYHAVPEHEYLDVYPANAPEKQQVIVRKFYFNENDPSPRMPHDASRWNDERYIKISSAISKDARNEASLRVLTSEMSGIWASIENFINYLKRLPTMMILSLVNIGITAIAILFLYFVNQNVGKLASFWLGS